MQPSDFSERLATIHYAIAMAAAHSGRKTEDITLIAVTKTQPLAMLETAYAAGIRDFGENRIAELREKQAQLPWPDVRWHMIGHIQSRKVKELVGHSTLIHSVDRLALAQELSKRAAQAGAAVDILLQVNSSGEESKGGWDVTRDQTATLFVEDVAQLASLPALRVRGLMAMAPYSDEADDSRPTFTKVRTVQTLLQSQLPDVDMGILSLGMSNDYRVAIEEGATHLRIGTALFGSR